MNLVNQFFSFDIEVIIISPPLTSLGFRTSYSLLYNLLITMLLLSL